MPDSADPAMLRKHPPDVLDSGRIAPSSLASRANNLYSIACDSPAHLILVVLISMAVVVFLQSRDVTVKREALATIATQLQEEGVEGARFDSELRFRAHRRRSKDLIANPGTIARSYRGSQDHLLNRRHLGRRSRITEPRAPCLGRHAESGR